MVVPAMLGTTPATAQPLAYLSDAMGIEGGKPKTPRVVGALSIGQDRNDRPDFYNDFIHKG